MAHGDAVREMPVPSIQDIFPRCRTMAGDDAWRYILHRSDSEHPDVLCKTIEGLAKADEIPAFLRDLADAERTLHSVRRYRRSVPAYSETYRINPSLDILPVSWQLSPLFEADPDYSTTVKEQEEWLLFWKSPEEDDVSVSSATPLDLLILKLLAQDLTMEETATGAGISIFAMHAALRAATRAGIAIGPPSEIVREGPSFQGVFPADIEARTVDTFTIQWHITNRCDLRCRHCYDRTKRSPLTFDQAEGILDDFGTFCRERTTLGHVCLTGGNPFMYPRFLDVYQCATDRGFSMSILGNPVPEEQLDAVLRIQRPAYFQVSLEGLQKQNDEIRGQGHFDRIMNFLNVLREKGVSSSVMLTLTKDNIDDVLPLAELLRDKTDHFTFNRLSPVGEGASLQLPEKDRYRAFLKEYVKKAEENPVMGFKDNLINVILWKKGRPLFDGCTGYGCGAAFNFVTILPDGEVHACRKFPSPIGNILSDRLSVIYDSRMAERYRQGALACRDCPIRAVCGGCLAVTSGCDLKIFEDRDPFCFMYPEGGGGRPRN